MIPNMQGSREDNIPDAAHQAFPRPPAPTSRACSQGRHHIPLRHALLPRSKSRERQQRKEQDRGSDYPGAGQRTSAHGKPTPGSAHTTELISLPPCSYTSLLSPSEPHSPSTSVCSWGSPEMPSPSSPGGAFPRFCHQSLFPGAFASVSSSIFPLLGSPLQSLFPANSPGDLSDTSGHTTPGLKTNSVTKETYGILQLYSNNKLT